MNRWEELYENHPIHETLKWLRECVTTEFDDLDEDEAIEKRRFIKLLSKYEDILEGLDVEVIPFNQLDSLNTALRNANFTNQINAYKEKGNVGNLVEANNLFTNQITQLCLLWSLGTTTEYHKPLKDIESLIDSTSQSLVQKKDKFNEDLKGLQSKSEEQETRLSDLANLIEKNKTEVESHISNWQSQFSSAQETRSQDYNNWRNTFSNESKQEIDSLIEENAEKLEKNNKEFSIEIDGLLTDGKEKHQSILELYEITAGDSVGASYLKNANDERRQADIWRIMSVLFIALTVTWMLFAYFSISNHSANADITLSKNMGKASESKRSTNEPSKKAIELGADRIYNNNFPWYKLFLTFSLSGVLLWGSAYSAQQSTKHRTNEKRNRWFALEVKSIDPFISTLDVEHRNEIKRQLTERIFGQSSRTDDENTKVIDEHALKVISEAFGKIISNLQK
jgi:hypothetical protein